MGVGLWAWACFTQHLERTLSRWLARKLPRLDDDDLADVWADTLLAVLKAARRGRFHADRPLLPWLCRIAYARAVDHLRCRNSWEHFLLHRTQSRPPQASAPLDEPDESAAQLRALMAAFVPTLPATQSTALALFLQHWPHSHATAVLHRKVTEHTGQPTTPGAVKRALQVARVKLRRFLLECGCDSGKTVAASECQAGLERHPHGLLPSLNGVAGSAPTAVPGSHGRRAGSSR